MPFCISFAGMKSLWEDLLLSDFGLFAGLVVVALVAAAWDKRRKLFKRSNERTAAEEAGKGQ